ncbi:hypothetical protein [Pacificispira sp.]|uniref:hypothetical protein n=1 Tax=Pacificispira sp. TaxID=2888761 RepID=UPI003B51B791
MVTKIHLGLTDVSSDVRVFVVHAGKQKKRLKSFLDLDQIFLDLPGLRLSENVLDDADTLSRHILMSEAISDWRRSERNEGKSLPAPSRTPSEYALPNKPKDLHRVGYKRTAVHRFFNEISKGDIVIVPGSTPYEPFWAGWVAHDADVSKTLTLGDFLGDPFPAREVKWISHNTTKRQLSDSLAKQLEKSHVVTEIDLNLFADEIFTNLFGTYVYKNRGGIDIHCPRYRGKNPLETVDVQELIAFFVANYEICHGQIASEFDIGSVSESGFRKIIQNYYDESAVLSLQQEFHSPGFYRIVSGSRELVYVLAFGIALTTSGCYDSQTVNTAEATASEADDAKLTTDEMRRLMGPMMKHISKSAIEEANQKGRNAQKELGVNTRTRVSR